MKDIADFNDHLDSENRIVTFYIPFRKNDIRESSRLLKDLCDSIYVCGYNMASNEIIEFDSEFARRDDVSVMYVTFEPKFSNYDFKFSTYLYHVTPFENIQKIKKNGLTPKSKHSFFKYPERVYLFNDCYINTILDYGIDVSIRSKSNRFLMLRIESAVLENDDLYRNGQAKFYID